jgi:hypothetical protein
MKIAIMQPYFFPYIGYFQLIAAVDKFVVFDDVNYINKGWINRNNILVSGKPCMITLPLKGASQNKRIHEIDLAGGEKELNKLLKTIVINYKRAPYFYPVHDLIQKIFGAASINIAEFNLTQLRLICNYLLINTQIIPSSIIYNNYHLKGEERIIDICIKENSDVYINPIGGIELYDRYKFEVKGIKLFFIKPHISEYSQLNHPFVPWLSIIDVLMFNSVEQVRQILKQYELV